jgi:hypothetical protein
MPKPTVATLFYVLAFVLFVIAALAAGGVVSMSGSGWLLPGGLAQEAPRNASSLSPSAGAGQCGGAPIS